MLSSAETLIPSSGRKVSKQVAEMITRHMVLRGILVEDAYFTGPYGSVTVKVKVLATIPRPVLLTLRM